MRGQTAIGHKVVFDFLRNETDGTAQLDEGQSFLPQIEDGFKADTEKVGGLFRRP